MRFAAFQHQAARGGAQVRRKCRAGGGAGSAGAGAPAGSDAGGRSSEPLGAGGGLISCMVLALPCRRPTHCSQEQAGGTPSVSPGGCQGDAARAAQRARSRASETLDVATRCRLSTARACRCPRCPLPAARCPMPDARRPNAKFLQNSYPGSAGLRRVAKGATPLRHPRAHPSEALSCGSGWETREGEFLRPRVVMPLYWPAGALVRSTQLPAPRMPRQGPALGSSITEAFKQAFGSTLLPGYERASLLVKRRLLRQRLLAPPGGCGGSDAPTHPIAPGAA